MGLSLSSAVPYGTGMAGAPCTTGEKTRHRVTRPLRQRIIHIICGTIIGVRSTCTSRTTAVLVLVGANGKKSLSGGRAGGGRRSIPGPIPAAWMAVVTRAISRRGQIDPNASTEVMVQK